MKKILAGVTALLLVLGCEKEPQDEAAVETAAPAAAPAVDTTDKKAQVKLAKAAVKAFAGALQTELQAAISAGGPVAAINVCNTQAMAITQQVAAEHGMQLSRVSRKYRNPMNAPNRWQTGVLEKFDAQQAEGLNPKRLSWSKIVEKKGQREFRFMKAIATGPVCLQCHGQEIAPEVSAALAALYPDDKATGFDINDIRGAFVVTRTLSD